MNKIRSFFANLKKSTIITLISCGCFIALSFIILCFFIMFPITPSEKVMATFGRESVSKSDGDKADVTTLAEGGEAIVASKGTTKTTTATTTVITTTHTDYTITVTSGSGFFSGGYIPAGGSPNDGGYYAGETTAAVEYTEENTEYEYTYTTESEYTTVPYIDEPTAPYYEEPTDTTEVYTETGTFEPEYTEPTEAFEPSSEPEETPSETPSEAETTAPPASEEPTEAPTEAPATEAPTEAEPVTEAPTEAPQTEPVTEAPAPEPEPETEAPAAEPAQESEEPAAAAEE